VKKFSLPILAILGVLVVGGVFYAHRFTQVRRIRNGQRTEKTINGLVESNPKEAQKMPEWLKRYLTPGVVTRKSVL